MVLMQPSMFRSSVDEVDYDPWGDDQDVQVINSGRESAEWERMTEEFMNAGYREGFDAGRAASMQPGFDAGYAYGARLGRELGTLRGMLGALLWMMGSPESQATPSGTGPDGSQLSDMMQEARDIVDALDKVGLQDFEDLEDTGKREPPAANMDIAIEDSTGDDLGLDFAKMSMPSTGSISDGTLTNAFLQEYASRTQQIFNQWTARRDGSRET